VSYGIRLGFVGAVPDAMLLPFVVALEMHQGIWGLKQFVESRSANETL